MIALLQRVSEARVDIAGETVGRIGPGLLVLVCAEPDDTDAVGQKLLAKILKLPDVQARLKGLGGEPGNLSPEQFSQMNRHDYEKFGALIKQANIKLE